MPEQRRWGFAGLSDEEYDDFVGSSEAPSRRPAKAVCQAAGEDSVVQVLVSIDGHGDITSVRLGRSWLRCELYARLHARSSASDSEALLVRNPRLGVLRWKSYFRRVHPLNLLLQSSRSAMATVLLSLQ